MSDARYLTANHYLAFVTVLSNASLYYVRIDLICERMSLSKSLLKLLSSSSLNDDSQQTLNLIRHLLSNFWNKLKISVKVSLLHLTNDFFNYQHYINNILFEFFIEFVQYYLNDILIYNKIKKEYIRYVRLILQKLIDANL